MLAISMMLLRIIKNKWRDLSVKSIKNGAFDNLELSRKNRNCYNFVILTF